MTDPEKVDDLTRKLLAVLNAHPMPLNLHATAIAAVTANIAVASGDHKAMRQMIADGARRMIVERRHTVQ